MRWSLGVRGTPGVRRRQARAGAPGPCRRAAVAARSPATMRRDGQRPAEDSRRGRCLRAAGAGASGAGPGPGQGRDRFRGRVRPAREAGERCGSPVRAASRGRAGPRRSRPAGRAAVGRWPGSLARQRSISGRTSAGHAIQARLAVDHAVDQRGGRPAAERPLARGGEGEDRAQAEDVAGRADLAAFGLLRRHEAGRADHQSGTRQRAGLGRSTEMPKSITRGPSWANSTFDGFRSRCTTPAA